MIKELLKRTPESERKKGIWPLEWAMIAYTLFTLVLISALSSELVEPVPMILQRVAFLALIAVTWWIYKIYPSRITLFLRISLVMMTLSRWYPDTWEFNRLFLNLDHLFAGWEQSLFGCQPSLLFSQHLPDWWASEPLYLGYFSYFPMIWVLVTWFWLKRPEALQRIAFIIMSGFFVYYIIYIFLPVAGPQFYYAAPGVDAANGVFPNVTDYFHDMREMYPGPGVDGPFHYLVGLAHEAGERPTAAFPSSHIGIATILLILAFRHKLHKLGFCLLPFYILLCMATVYIHAHYLVDAIAGFITSFIVYFLLSWVYKKFFEDSNAL